ncbi:MAG: SMI1/KNR4 family protein [Myxococcales bacterium]|nr:SMI1/KNR4 family protein [Myxococcales bacterium]
MKHESSTAQILDKLRSLGIRFRPGPNGPYGDDELARTEAQIGRKLAPVHAEILRSIGGAFSFDGGAADVGDSSLNIKLFFGIGGDFDIGGWNADYAGQVPGGWYPFGQDHGGDLYLLTDEDAVRHVVLREELWSSPDRPPSSGSKVASSLGAFIAMLRAHTEL